MSGRPFRIANALKRVLSKIVNVQSNSLGAINPMTFSVVRMSCPTVQIVRKIRLGAMTVRMTNVVRTI